MDDRQALEALFEKRGYTDYRWIDPRDIIVAQWVRMKCTFGCGSYGRNASCPPNVPSVPECRRFFDEYTAGAILHFEQAVDKPEDRFKWSREVNEDLLALERAVFLAGHERAFLLFMDSCRLCSSCTALRTDCKRPDAARPSLEAMAVDVYSTVRQHGYPIQVLTDYGQTMQRYACLLVE